MRRLELRFRWWIALVAVLVSWGGRVEARAALTSAQVEFFEQRVRPVLVNECEECHGAQQQKGGLRLDSAKGWMQGGESGPAVLPGDPEHSRLIQAIARRHPQLAMPKDRPRLPDSVIADLTRWVEMGAPDPRSEPPSGTASKATAAGFEARRDWWSFRPLQRPALPTNGLAATASNQVDRFIRAALEARGLQPAPAAERRVLLRRLTFALTGLPPTPEEMEAFANDPAPDAYERQVDRLLASPRFGEAWARHWMDLVRYCESHGSQGDPELPMAWRYRDYLVRAFNQDVPYDRLVKEHLAGDLLPEPRINFAEGLNESTLGPAHLRMVELGYIPVDALDDQVKVVDNQIDVFSKAFLGLTVSCARCHDHKFDPIRQTDFYALYGIFASARPGQIVIDTPERQRVHRDELASLKRQIREGLATAWESAALRIPERLRQQVQRSTELSSLATTRAAWSAELASLDARARARLAKPGGATPPTAVPVPLARWTFEQGLKDDFGSLDGELQGSAEIHEGRLILRGTNAWMITPALPVTLTEKTLEAWVVLDDLTQRGGGVLTVQTPDSQVFDSIVFGEREPGHWIAGSDFFRRTRDVGGPAESARPGERVHLAITYGTNQTITIYRNGTPYGTHYDSGATQPFEAGKARVVLGRRHLAPGIESFHGEVEEARLYARALTAEEIRQSFEAGLITVGASALAAAFTDSERTRWQELGTALKSQSARQAELQALDSADALGREVQEAVKKDTSALHPWAVLATTEPSAFPSAWSRLTTQWREELAHRREFNRSHFTNVWDLTGGQAGEWFWAGDPQPVKPSAPGEFSVEVQGPRVLSGLYPSGVFSHLLTRKQPGVLTSPRFVVPGDNLSVRALGEHSMVRVVVENYAIGSGGIYPGRGLDSDELRWLRLDTAYRKGAHAYLELVTSEDFPSPGFRSGGRAYEAGRAYWGLAEVAFHDGTESPREVALPISTVFAGGEPQSVPDLAAIYGRQLTLAIAHWREDRMSEDEERFLDAFVRPGILPVKMEELPQVASLVEQYRRLESDIPVPRRAPGVHEAAGFDQPLFIRGRPDRPAEPVPRRNLELLGGKPFSTRGSGRLELAEELVRSENPLLARVLVNRVWNYVFGRGLVGTVDNFGRLGEQPTHPELLDYLALRFLERGLSIKDLIRFLVTSETFRQSALASTEARQVDPSNQWLSHARVHRLEAEAIRDAILAVAGQLDLRMSGLGVNVYYVGKTEGGGPVGPLDGEGRRSLYQRIRRNAQNPFLEAFDAPKPMSTRGRRDVTNVPAQSLTLLNDPFVIELSTRWARELVRRAEPRRTRIEVMFRRALGRAPTAQEIESADAFLNELALEHSFPESDVETSAAIWRDLAQSLFCLKEFIYVE